MAGVIEEKVARRRIRRGPLPEVILDVLDDFWSGLRRVEQVEDIRVREPETARIGQVLSEATRGARECCRRRELRRLRPRTAAQQDGQGGGRADGFAGYHLRSAGRRNRRRDRLDGRAVQVARVDGDL